MLKTTSKHATETTPASKPLLIHIIDDDPVFISILKRYTKPHIAHGFANAIEAVQALEKELPDLIFLDILLDGPNGFTYLNEIASYADTAKIPVVLISSLYHTLPKMSSYNVIAYLDKASFTPDDVQKIIANTASAKTD